MLVHRGIEYCFVLEKEYNYFDIVPDLEKLLRRRVEYRNNKMLVIIPMKETDDRVLKSSYYQQRKDTWFKYTLTTAILDGTISDDIKLSVDEQNILQTVRNHLQYGTCYTEGWYDVYYVK
jgi:hypothetical protein